MKRRQCTSAASSMPRNMGSIMMRAAGVLLCLVLFSVHLMGGLYARYTSGGWAEDEARVAKFEVQVTGKSDNLEPNQIKAFYAKNTEDNNTYTISIANHSEVDVRYTLSATLDKEIPGVTPVFSNATGTLEAGNTSAQQTLVFQVDWETFAENGTPDSSYTVTAQFTVKVTVEQVD